MPREYRTLLEDARTDGHKSFTHRELNRAFGPATPDIYCTPPVRGAVANARASSSKGSLGGRGVESALPTRDMEVQGACNR